LDIAFIGRYPYEGSGIEFSSDAPIEAGSLEGIRAFALLSLGVTLCSAIGLPYPCIIVKPNSYTAEQITFAFVMLPLPILRTYGLVKDSHIASGILVQEENKTVLLYALHTAFNLVCG
jgi:hypothetical protein